jgi:Tfp pilus assembly protein PilP
MNLTIGILAAAMMTGGMWAQNPTIINNVQSTMNSVQQKKTSDSNAALAAAGVPTQAQTAKPAPGSPQSAKAQTAQSKPNAPAAKSAAVPATKTGATTAAQPHDPMKPKVPKGGAAHAHPVVAAKTAPAKPAAKKATNSPAPDKPATAAAPNADAAKTADASKAPKAEDKKWAMTGKRDPFFSPVVQQPTGSGCSTGKKCLEIGQINLRGVVHSDNGFIAVVTNNLNKAYFLRENDPVFNGYVVKITGDSVVFQETVQDKLGKSFTREVVKRIFTPAV